MPILIRTPDGGLTDPSHSWLHLDGSITPATEEEIAEHFDDEPALS